MLKIDFALGVSGGLVKSMAIAKAWKIIFAPESS
jgi:hypothetical protein